jgi:lipopolysaccharide/colanic/teichoic acid biosynthesis glycosyltransferase
VTDPKRALDVAVAGPLLLVSAPVQAAVAVAVAARLGRPVLFRQQRPGLHGEPFTILKFRTMRPVDVATGRVDDASRLTRLGRFLRATSLDELPTLVNVLRGEMSLVGPRPLLMAYLHRYSATQARRQEVRPGLTGLAQVSGRNAVGWDERLALDVEYVDTRSMRLDLAILRRTVGAVLRREGITAEGEATMPEFLGRRSAA